MNFERPEDLPAKLASMRSLPPAVHTAQLSKGAHILFAPLKWHANWHGASAAG